MMDDGRLLMEDGNMRSDVKNYTELEGKRKIITNFVP